MSFSWDDKEIRKKSEEIKLKFLHGAGHIGVNQASEYAHKVTGTLRNSIMYALKDKDSGFQSIHGESPPDDAKLSRPKSSELVRIGSAVIYANRQERLNGWATKAFNRVTHDGTLDSLIKKVAK